MRFASLVGMALLLMATMSAQFAEPVQAACGTAWTSRKEPPPSILVLRTATGVVEKVGFKRYVAVVMASGEWPSTLPKAVLEAGALTTKQYGWYYTLKGNHRSGDKNAAGKCYDVRDDSRDQVYGPESAEPTDKQKRARDALWGLSLRKNGKFFLTGYRRGETVPCGSDATGYKLFARSAKDCAKRRDFGSERIVRKYFRPKLTFVWMPGTDPDEQPQASDAPDAGEDGGPSASPTAPAPSTPAGPTPLDGFVPWLNAFVEAFAEQVEEVGESP